MNDPTDTFHRLRPRLQGIAYRMLGSSAEAEDVVQDAWLRWHESPHDQLDSSEAWLVTITTRLAIDRLRSAKLQREHYVGTWLPEPLLSDAPVTPEQSPPMMPWTRSDVTRRSAVATARALSMQPSSPRIAVTAPRARVRPPASSSSRSRAGSSISRRATARRWMARCRKIT